MIFAVDQTFYEQTFIGVNESENLFKNPYHRSKKSGSKLCLEIFSDLEMLVMISQR